MCALCRQTPCDPRCPNAPETDYFTDIKCAECGYELRVGERYLKDADGDCICETCLRKLKMEDWLEIFDASLDEAE